MLGAWAEATSRVEIGALVTCNSYRNPELLADMARTVDHISGGRLILGIGAGWFERDYDEYGYDFGTAGSRLADLAQALPRIRDRWSKLNPAPTREIPILIGGGGEKKTLRYTAEHAQIWHSFGDVDTLVRKNGILDGHCADMGRDPALIERSIGVRQPPGEVADALVEAGATLFTVGVGGPDYDLSLLKEWIAWRDARAELHGGRPWSRAGLLLHRTAARRREPEVLLGHMGGPSGRARTTAPGRSPRACASPARSPRTPPGASSPRRWARSRRARSSSSATAPGQRQALTAFALARRPRPGAPASNTVELEWPPRSGRVTFPEIDRAAWFDLDRGGGEADEGPAPAAGPPGPGRRPVARRAAGERPVMTTSTPGRGVDERHVDGSAGPRPGPSHATPSRRRRGAPSGSRAALRRARRWAPASGVRSTAGVTAVALSRARGPGPRRRGCTGPGRGAARPGRAGRRQAAVRPRRGPSRPGWPPRAFGAAAAPAAARRAAGPPPRPRSSACARSGGLPRRAVAAAAQRRSARTCPARRGRPRRAARPVAARRAWPSAAALPPARSPRRSRSLTRTGTGACA